MLKKVIVTFKKERDVQILLDNGAENIEEPTHIRKVVICDINEDTYEVLINEDSIKDIEFDDDVDTKTLLDATSSQATTYAFDLMGAKKFHDEGIKGKGVKLAVIDSGIQKHEDLKITGGFNAYDESKPYDKDLASTHGTKIAGVVAAQDNGKGMLGVAPDCELYAVRIDDGGGSINRTQWSAQIKALNWCIENKMDAINCSFSSKTESSSREEAFREAYDAGIAIFCSAGNRQGDDVNRSTIVYPSNYTFVNTVANITKDKKRYKTSSVGRGINFSSGGDSVRTTTLDKDREVSAKYANGTGTSFATPAVMGMFALYKEKYGESRDQIIQRMHVNAERIGDEKMFGSGIPKYPTDNYKNIQIRGRTNAD